MIDMSNGHPETPTDQPQDVIGEGEITNFQEAVAALQVERAARLRQDEILVELRIETARQKEERAKLEEKVTEMTETQRLGFFGLSLQHPVVRRDETGNVIEGKEPYVDLREQYAAIISREANKMERRPFPYDNFRVLGLLDFLEGITTNEGILKELNPEQAGMLSREILEYFEMREAIWNRIYWHKKAMGYLKVICAEDSPQPAAEQLAMFENDPYRPEIRAAVEVFLDPQITGWFIFGKNFPDVGFRGKVCTPYIYTMLTSESRGAMYQMMEKMIVDKTREITEEKVKLSPLQAKRAREKVEAYLGAVGWSSISDPGMMLDVNDELRDAAFGGTRSRERLFGIKPAGPVFGATLFTDRLVYTDAEGRKRALNSYKDREQPLILLESKDAGEPQYLGSLYHSTIGARISEDGRSLVVSRPSGVEITRGAGGPRMASTSRPRTLEIPLKGIGIRGERLATQAGGIAEGEIRGKMVKLRLIDLMTDLDTGKIKPLSKEIWPYLSSNLFGNVIGGWFQAGMTGEASGFYGLSQKEDWRPEDITYSGVRKLHHKVRSGLMNNSPLLNVLTNDADAKPSKGEWLVVKIDNEGKVHFGRGLRTGLRGRAEIHEMLTARLVLLALSTLTMRAATPHGKGAAFLGGKLKQGSYVEKRRRDLLARDDIEFLIEGLLNPPYNAPEIFKTKDAQDELRAAKTTLGWE